MLGDLYRGVGSFSSPCAGMRRKARDPNSRDDLMLAAVSASRGDSSSTRGLVQQNGAAERSNRSSYLTRVFLQLLQRLSILLRILNQTHCYRINRSTPRTRHAHSRAIKTQATSPVLPDCSLSLQTSPPERALNPFWTLQLMCMRMTIFNKGTKCTFPAHWDGTIKVHHLCF